MRTGKRQQDAVQQSQPSYGWRKLTCSIETLLENDGRDQSGAGKDDIVGGRNGGRVEELERLVEVVDLYEQRNNDKAEQKVDEPVLELVLTADGEQNRGPETGRDADTETADERADGNVDEHVLLAVLGCKEEDEHERGSNADAGPCEETGSKEELLKLGDLAPSMVRGRVDGDDDASDDAEETPNLAKESELFLEEDGREDGADDNRESTKRGDQHRIRKGVRNKVEYLTKDHDNHAGPPHGRLEVGVALAGSSFVLFLCG